MLNFIKRKYTSLVSDTRFSEIFTGSVWALSAQMLATGLGLISSILIARFYGAEVLGIVAVINSFLILATIFTVLGTDISILRLIPEHIAKYSLTSAFKVYRKVQYMVIGISLAASALFFWGANIIADQVFSKPHLSYYFALASVFVIFKSLMLFNTQAVRGLRLVRMFAFMLVLPQSFNLLFLIAIGFFWPDKEVPVYALLSGFAMTGIAGWLIMKYAFKKKLHPDDSVQHVPTWDILRISLPMLLTATMAFIIGQTGVIMIGMFRSETELGYYAVAVKLSALTTFVLQAVNSMAGPKFSELFHSDKIDDLFQVAKKSAKLIFWATTPIFIVFLVLGKPILSIVFGREFGVVYPALVFLVMGQFVNTIAGSTGMFMNMTGNQSVYRNIMIIAAALNITLNMFLIPDLGFNGAAIAAMISLCFWNIVTLLYIKLKYNKTPGYFPLYAHHFSLEIFHLRKKRN